MTKRHLEHSTPWADKTNKTTTFFAAIKISEIYRVLERILGTILILKIVPHVNSSKLFHM